jgi:hypothetical protein
LTVGRVHLKLNLHNLTSTPKQKIVYTQNVDRSLKYAILIDKYAISINEYAILIDEYAIFNNKYAILINKYAIFTSKYAISINEYAILIEKTHLLFIIFHFS